MSKKVLPGFLKNLSGQGVLIFFCTSFWTRQGEKRTTYEDLKVVSAPL